MTLYEKIKAIYPELTIEDFAGATSTIVIQNDADGKGDYIAKWEHLTFARPTEEQIAKQGA